FFSVNYLLDLRFHFIHWDYAGARLVHHDDTMPRTAEKNYVSGLKFCQCVTHCRRPLLLPQVRRRPSERCRQGKSVCQYRSTSESFGKYIRKLRLRRPALHRRILPCGCLVSWTVP